MNSAQIRNYFAEMVSQETRPDKAFSISRKAYNAQKDQFPEAVQKAYDHYIENVEMADWGSARLYQPTVEDHAVFVVLVTTDGDDGWLEIYDEQGEAIGLGKTYLGEVKWTV